MDPQVEEGGPPRRLEVIDSEGREIVLPSTVPIDQAINAFLHSTGHHHEGLDALSHFLGALLGRTVAEIR